MAVNTIIIPFRATAQIPLCLASLAVCEDVEQHSVLLAQHGGRRWEFDHDDRSLCYFYVADQGPLHLAKLINAAVRQTNTEWITILQPDLLVPMDFLSRLQIVMSRPMSRRCYFPVRYLDSTATSDLELDFNCFYRMVIPARRGWRRGCETYKGHATGTDCFAVRTRCYFELGGYDERFHEWNLAAIDFSRRWLNVFGAAERIDCDLFHRWHRLNFINDGCRNDIHERQLFDERERNGFPRIEMNEAWGVFPRPMDD